MNDMIGIGLGLLLSVGVVWKWVKAAMVPVKEVAELLIKVTKAAEDKKFTKAEIESIIEEAKDIPESLSAIKILLKTKEKVDK